MSLDASAYPLTPTSPTTPLCPHIQMIRTEIEAAKARVELLSAELMAASGSLQGLYRQLKAHSCSAHASVRRVGFSLSQPIEVRDDELAESVLDARKRRALQREQERDRQEQEGRKEEEEEEEEEGEEMDQAELVRQMEMQQSVQEENSQKGSLSTQSEVLHEDKQDEGPEPNITQASPVSLTPSSSLDPRSSLLTPDPLNATSPDLDSIAESLELALGYIESQHDKEEKEKEKEEEEEEEKEEEKRKGVKTNEEPLVATMPAQTLTFSFGEEEEASEEEPEQEEHDEKGASIPSGSLSFTSGSALKRKASDRSQLSLPPSSPKRQRLDSGKSEEEEQHSEVIRLPATKGMRRIWKRHNVSRRLQRLATNGEELSEVIRRMLRQMEEQQRKRQAALEELQKRRKRRSSGAAKASLSKEEKEWERTRTMEETVKDGCAWLLSILPQAKVD